MNETQRIWLRGRAADIVLHVRRGRWHTTEVEQALTDFVTHWPLVAAQASPPTPPTDFETCRAWIRQCLAAEGYQPNELQMKFRDGFYDPRLVELAICDALVEQGYITARPGDGVGCVAQMIDAQRRVALALSDTGETPT